MEEALKALLPASLEGNAGLIAGALMALLVFIAGWIVSKWTHRLITRVVQKRGLDESLGRFLASIAQYAVLAAFTIAALEHVGIASTSLVAIFASAGLAVGLALQGSLGNFASGVMILLFRPFTLNDKIQAGGSTGVVADIGLFATTLMTPHNETVIVPNSAVTGGVITNYTKVGTLRADIAVGVAYGQDIGKVMEILMTAVQNTDLVLKDPAPAIAFVEMAASSINFSVMCWSTCDDFLGMQHNVRKACYEALNAANIEIPFDQLVIHKA
jgi:small conductance mechanosensitive channel